MSGNKMVNFPIPSPDNTACKQTERVVASEVMHDIRNPLEILSNLNYLILHNVDDPNQVQTYARLAEKQLQMLCHSAMQSLDNARTSDAHNDIDLVDLTEVACELI